MRKLIIFALNVILIFLLQITASAAKYIVKPKADTAMLMSADTFFEPLVPELGLYTTEDITNLDESMFEFVEENSRAVLFNTYDYSALEQKAEYANTGIKSMWDIGVYGQTVKVGVIDSGCNKHVSLEHNLLSGKNVIDGSDDISDNIKNQYGTTTGHGTGVCGMIAAEYGVKNTIGTAHKAAIVPLKFIDMDSSGNYLGGMTSDAIAAIVAAVDDFDCDVINLSFGLAHSQALEEAINYAAEKGAVIVAAVGNEATKTSVAPDKYNYPAAYEQVIGVGAVDEKKNHSSYSNKNNSVFLTAPGNNLTVLRGENTTMTANGTSYAAPYVSGVIADMLCINPELTLEEIKTVLKNTAEDLGDAGYDMEYGYGLVNVNSIIEEMLADRVYFTSGIDVCSADNFSEVRFKLSDGNNCCILAEYEDCALKQLVSVPEQIKDDVYMLRLPYTEGSEYKSFVWNSFEDMCPVQMYKQ